MLLTVDFMFVQWAWASWSVCSKVSWFWGLDVWSVRASQRGERTSRTSVSLCLMTSPAAPMTSVRVRIFTTISCKNSSYGVFFVGVGFIFPLFISKGQKLKLKDSLVSESQKKLLRFFSSSFLHPTKQLINIKTSKANMCYHLVFFSLTRP